MQASTGVENRSLIDPATWASSDLSSPPDNLLAETTARGVQDRDSGLSNLALKTPAAPRRPQAPASVLLSSVHATPLPSRTPAPMRPPAMKPAAGAAASGTRISNMRPANPPKFSKLARGSSEDMEDHEPLLCRERSPVKLGKRTEPRRSKSPLDEEPSRPAKRLVWRSHIVGRMRVLTTDLQRVGTRTRAGTRQSEENGASKVSNTSKVSSSNPSNLALWSYSYIVLKAVEAPVKRTRRRH